MQIYLINVHDIRILLIWKEMIIKFDTTFFNFYIIITYNEMLHRHTCILTIYTLQIDMVI